MGNRPNDLIMFSEYDVWVMDDQVHSGSKVESLTVIRVWMIHINT